MPFVAGRIAICRLIKVCSRLSTVNRQYAGRAHPGGARFVGFLTGGPWYFPCFLKSEPVGRLVLARALRLVRKLKIYRRVPTPMLRHIFSVWHTCNNLDNRADD